KLRGMLTLNCTEVTQNQTGIGVEWALLNMARGFGGGDNILSNNTTNLLLDFALGVNINYGYNEFSDPGSMNIEGSMMGSCGVNCSNGGLFPCANNTWLVNDFEIGPDSNYNVLYRIDQCDGIGTSEFCPTTFYAFSQYAPPTCPNRRFRNPWKLASDLEAENGEQAYKEYTYRLSKAASLLTINNPEGNDEDVIVELAALVQSGVFDDMDDQDRYWSLVLKQTMRTALSSLNEGQVNQGAFTLLESSYVDVLNYFDDHYQTWSKVDYRLAHEQTKSSFFHARGDTQTSRTILEKSGECGLNEKLHEIHHRIKCNLFEETAKKDNGLHSIISNDLLTLDVELDPIENNPTASQNCFISSASNVEFGTCGTPPLMNAQLESVGIYPNPNEGNFKVILKDFQTCEEILIWNSLGQVVQSFNCTDQIEFQFNLDLTKGIYIIEFRGENKSITDKLVIR
ncbi:MAG: T9SS type A sorting domain-containing protein, partial [Flavobacteriales bacterium]